MSPLETDVEPAADLAPGSVATDRTAGSSGRQGDRQKPSPPDQRSPDAAVGKTALSIQGLSTWYGDAQAIFDVDMDIPENSITAYIGPSGCGKSTLLRWINRMNDSIGSARAEGSIRLRDEEILDRRLDVVDLRRRVGMVFQKPNPFPKTIYQNIAFGASLHMKIGRSDLDALVEWSLRKASLWEEVKDRLHESALGLSGGQQQRLCIARAIAVGPEVLLMDEPCSALDPISTSAVEDLMHELRDNYTIVIVTHNMQQASRVSDRTAFLYQGKLIEYDLTSSVFTTPREQRTADYISGRFG